MIAFTASRLQQAVYAALVSDPALVARLEGLYDEPPVGAPLPYLSLGETRVTDSSVKDRDGLAIEFDVNLWTDTASQMDVKDLMAVAREALEAAQLNVPGHDLLEVRLTAANTTRQFSARGSLMRGHLVYRAQLYEQASA